MRAAWVVLVVLACVVWGGAEGASYEGLVQGGRVQVQRDGSELAPAVAVGGGGVRASFTLTVGGAAVAIAPTASTFAAVSASIHAGVLAGVTGASCAEVVAPAPGVFMCVEADNAPTALFFLGSLARAFKCPALLNAPVEHVSCTSDSGSVVNVTLASADFSIGSATWSLDAADAALETPFAVFAALKLAGGASFSAATREIRNRNQVRRDESRTAVIFLFVFIAAGMTVLAGVCAIWQGWIYPIFPSQAEFWWFSIFFCLMHLVSWVGGLAGWICILSLVGLYITLMPLVYVCIRWQHRRLLARAGLDDNQLDAKYGEQQESESESESESGLDSGSDRDDETETYDETETAASTATSEASAAAERTQAAIEAVSASRERRALAFTQQPSKLGRAQAFWLLGLSVAFFVCGALCAVIFFSWSIDDYYVWDRNAGAPVVEFQPKLVAKTIGVIYSYDRFAALMRFDWLLQAQTKACGVLFKKTLKSDSEKKTKIFDAFIDKYSIDMSIYARPSYTQYSSVNDWFTRELSATARPARGGGTDPSVILSSADCRVVVYESVPADLKIWLKGEVYTAEQLLHYNAVAATFHGGPIAILRLAPADYHRTHSPVAGTIIDQYKIKSTIYSVGADAMRSNNGAIYNTRTITILQTSHSPPRHVAYTAIAATCVGSVVSRFGVGATVDANVDWSEFQFGSTVVVQFPPGSVDFDDDLVYNSNNGVESLITVGSQIGRWK